MKINRIFALLLAAVMLLSVFTGCNTAEPNVTDPSGSIENTADPTDGTDSTSGTTGTEDPTGTTGSNPAGNETISGTETTEPSTNPTNPGTQPSECAHSWSDWATKKAATCTADGSEERTCSKCGEKEQRTATATGHTWDSGTVTATPASCSDIGSSTYTCKTCGNTKTEQITGSHTFGDWQWEEYAYTIDYGEDHPGYVPGFPTTATYTSHRMVRTCAKCGYKETDGTADHPCTRGSLNHTVTTVKEGTCTTKATMRSTCKICGWYVEYEGKTSSHTVVDETRHLTDYGDYTNELDVVLSECTVCGATDVSYIYGEGFADYRRYRNAVVINQGTAYASRSPNGTDFLNHPTWQTVIRDYQYDSDGYVNQFTVYWHDASGNRYSQTINCTAAHLLSWFAEYGLTGGDGVKYQFKISGNQIVPWKISWTS